MIFLTSIKYDLQLIHFFLNSMSEVAIFFLNNCCLITTLLKIIDIFLSTLIKFIEDLKKVLYL